MNGMNPMNYLNRSTIINGYKDYNIIDNNKIEYQTMKNNTGLIFPRNLSSSHFITKNKKKYNIIEKNNKAGKNRNFNNSFKNPDLSNLRKNYSSSDMNYNYKQKSSFSSLNNNPNFHHPYSTPIDQNQNYQNNNYSESIKNHNNNYNRSFNFKNSTLGKLDKNINEKVISSPFQAYQTYQKEKKVNNLSNRTNQSLNAGKRILFDINKEKEKKKKNINNNYQSNFFNIKGKEARILQHLVYNLQSNIPEYDKHFINEQEVKNMKNKLDKNNNI